MQGHTLRTLSAGDFESCRLKCYLEDNCVSVNFESTGKCDLNGKDHTQKPNDLVDAIDNSYSSVENPCASSPCQHPNVLCQVGFTGRGYRCNCNKTGFAGETCEKAVLRIFVKSFGTKDRPDGAIFGDTIIEVNGINHCKKRRGHNIVTVYPGNGSIHASKSFDTHDSAQASADMTTFINSLPENIMVLIAVHDSALASVMRNTPGAESALRNVGAVDPVFTQLRESWLLIGYKGADKPTWIQQRYAARNLGPVSIGTEIIF